MAKKININTSNTVQFSEGRLQSQIFIEFWNLYPEYRGLLYHIYNNPRSKIQGAQLKAMGLIKGMPDLCLAIPNNEYAALYIELKLPGEELKPNQIEQHVKLKSFRNKVVTCYTKEEALRELKEYITL